MAKKKPAKETPETTETATADAPPETPPETPAKPKRGRRPNRLPEAVEYYKSQVPDEDSVVAAFTEGKKRAESASKLGFPFNAKDQYQRWTGSEDAANIVGNMTQAFIDGAATILSTPKSE